MGDLPRVIRETLVAEASKLSASSVAVMLSGGMDSLGVAVAAREAGKRVTCYAFHVDGVMSRDVLRARAHAARLGFEFEQLPLFMRDAEVLAESVREIKRRYGATKKTTIECVYPFFATAGEIRESALLTGHAADGYFAISKRAMIHYRRDRMDEWREQYFANPDAAQSATLRKLYADHGIEALFPFVSPALLEAFRGSSWESINRPRQKQPIRDAFAAEFAGLRIEDHVNLQLGDSRIAEAFEVLLTSRFNTRNSRSVTAIYNDL